MCVLKKGLKLRTKFSIITIIAIVVLSGACFTNKALAQESKPNLIKFEITEETNNQNALEIAKKINPRFFNYDKNFRGGSPDIKYITRYLDLDNENPKRFLLLTVRNTPYYCTKIGCPHIIYENVSGNKWRESLSLMVYSLYHDKNTSGSHPNNVIGRGFDPQKGTALGVWVWNGKGYINARK